MATKKQILAFLKSKESEFRKEFGITKLGLIGSYATGKETNSSDIDLIVEFANGTEELFDVKEKIKKIIRNQFHLKVDICRQKYLKPYIRNRILKNAIFV